MAATAAAAAPPPPIERDLTDPLSNPDAGLFSPPAAAPALVEGLSEMKIFSGTANESVRFAFLVWRYRATA